MEIGLELRSLREEVLKNRAENKAVVEASEARLALQFEELKQKLQKLDAANNTLTKKVELLERNFKKNNILIFGLENSHTISPDQICTTLSRLLKINIGISDINNVYCLKNIRNQPIKIEFLTFLKKLEILRNCKNLKGTGISICQDLTFKQREENKKLKIFLDSFRQDSETRSYIKGNKLYVENKAYTLEELEQIQDLASFQERKTNSAPSTPSGKTNHSAEEEAPGTFGEQKKKRTEVSKEKETENRSLLETKNKEKDIIKASNKPGEITPTGVQKGNPARKLTHPIPNTLGRNLRSTSVSSNNMIGSK